MSQEVFKIIQSMDLKKLEMQLALQCSPLIAGLKISNLLIVHNDNAKNVMEMFKDTDISYFILCITDEKTTFLLYKFEELSEYMNEAKVRKLMNVLGYKNNNFDEVLTTLGKQYEKYTKNEIEFPHEMGLLLGYPVEDVYGFIKNNGKNSLYSGYWKVYDNLAAKLNLFEKYNEAKETVIKLVSCGITILEIVNIYSENKLLSVAG